MGMQVFTGSVLIFLFMFALWTYYLKDRNGAIIDIGWALCFTIAGTIAILFGIASGLKSFLFALMIYPWSLRLAYHLWSRYNPKSEDPRYTKIKQKWGNDKSGIKFLGMFVLQALLAAFIAYPFYPIMNDPHVGFWFLVSFVIVTLGWIGEAVADKQLDVFKKRYPKKVCDFGLWSRSRHPNYFFEWIVWIGFTLAALNSGSYLSLISFALMSYLLIGFSGVPMTEAHMDESKGADWQEYKRRVPPFLPKI